MKPWGWILGLFLLWLAAVVDYSLMAAWGPLWTPRLAAGVVLTFALCSRPAHAALAAFVAAWLSSSMAGASMVHLALPQILGAFAISHARQLQVDLNTWTAGVWIGAGALVIQVATLLLLSPSGLASALLLAPVSALLTAAASLPVYAVLSRSAAAQGP